MGSVSVAGEDESQPSTSNAKTFLDGCGGVNHASIPRKLRSAIKKRGRESVASPLLFSRKQHDMSITADTVRKIGAKKSRLNKKKGHITKDEKEVAETLFALAGMFSDTNKADQQKIGDEKPDIKPSDTHPPPQEEAQKISSKVNLERPSNLASSTAEQVVNQTKEARQVELFSGKKAMTPNASGGQSDLSPGSISRTRVSMLDMNQSVDQEIFLDQVAASGLQYGKNCSSISDKHKDLFLPPNLTATRATSSEKPKSCPRSSSARSRETIFSSQPRVIENKITTGEYTRVPTKSNKSWKRCSAHVYISRLIKVLKLSEVEEGSQVKPTQLTACGGAELLSHVRIDGRNEGTHFSAIDVFHAKKDSSETQNGIFHKRPIQDHQTASETSAFSSKQGYDFLSLGTRESANNRAECFLEPPKQYHMQYMPSENQSSILCSLPRNGYSSSLQNRNSPSEAHQVQLSQYNSNLANSNFMQQKWAAQLQTHYSSVSKNGGVDSASVLNYAHSLFPHLHAALGSKYQHHPPPHHQLMLMNASLPLSSMKRRQNLPLGFERNGGVLNPESTAQLQLSCNQHL